MSLIQSTPGMIFDNMDAPDVLNARPVPQPLSFKTNSHIHLPPNFSAFDNVEQAIDLIDQQGISVVGVSNYYDYGVYADFTRLAGERSIFPLFGTEIIALVDELVASGVKINDPGNPGKMYICGKGIVHFDPLTDEGVRLLNIIREKDSTRMAAMVDRLALLFNEAGFASGLNADAVKQMIVRRHGCRIENVYLQERHIAQAFQEALAGRLNREDRLSLLTAVYGFAPKSDVDDAVAVQNDIRSYLMKAGKPAYVPETFVSYNHARRLILALGGIPCYPVLIDGASPLCPFEETPEGLVGRVKEMGVYCTEFIPLRNSPEMLLKYVVALRNAGIVVTAGTEHNTLDLLPIEPACKKGVPIPEEAAVLFREGARVVAAHQYSVYKGVTGFVDENGNLNEAYSSNDARISSFAELGAKVINRYLYK